MKDILPTGNAQPRNLTKVGSSIFFVHSDGSPGMSSGKLMERAAQFCRITGMDNG